MAVTPGRASASYQTVASSYETLYESSSTNAPCRGFKIANNATAAATIRVTGVHNRGTGGATFDEYLVDASETVEFYADAITKVEAKSASSAAMKWTVLCA